MEDSTLIYFGDAIRAVGDDGKVGGYLVRFTSAADPDPNYGTFFDARTDYDIEDGDKLSVYYHQGMDGTLGKKRIGRGVVRFDDVGIWMDAQLDMANEYVKALAERGIRKGKMGWSSGAASHLVEFVRTGNAEWTRYWPIKDASITPTPSEIRNKALPSLRSLIDTGEDNPQASAQAIEAEAQATEEDASDARARVQVRARAYLLLSKD